MPSFAAAEKNKFLPYGYEVQPLKKDVQVQASEASQTSAFLGHRPDHDMAKAEYFYTVKKNGKVKQGDFFIFDAVFKAVFAEHTQKLSDFLLEDSKKHPGSDAYSRRREYTNHSVEVTVLLEMRDDCFLKQTAKKENTDPLTKFVSSAPVYVNANGLELDVEESVKQDVSVVKAGMFRRPVESREIETQTDLTYLPPGNTDYQI